MSDRLFKVSDHAIQRYRERVRDVPDCVARADLSSPAFAAAVRFGAQVVRVAGRYRAVIEFTPISAVVLTVLPDGATLPVQLMPPRWGHVPWLIEQHAGFGPA